MLGLMALGKYTRGVVRIFSLMRPRLVARRVESGWSFDRWIFPHTSLRARLLGGDSWRVLLSGRVAQTLSSTVVMCNIRRWQEQRDVKCRVGILKSAFVASDVYAQLPSVI